MGGKSGVQLQDQERCGHGDERKKNLINKKTKKTLGSAAGSGAVRPRR